MKNFYENDKSGKKKKFIYMVNNYPLITEDILNWAKENNLYGLPFDELSYLKYYGLNKVPLDEKGYKRFKSWNKGYSKLGKYKSLEEKFILNDIDKFKNMLINNNYRKQNNGGYITQIITNNYLLYYELKNKFNNDIPIRQKVNMLLNDINEIPKCKICNKNTKARVTHAEFRETCSEKCRRILESNYKSYTIVVDSENIKVQGYERYVIPLLINKYGRDDILIGHENNPIEYYYNGKNRLYYPDVYIKSENKIIEVKSTFSFKYDKDKNLAKRDGCILKSFNFEFHIWDKNKIKIIK
jgi:endogenous inhibitor of DNA gyrase (YacG/DUF329 family)